MTRIRISERKEYKEQFRMFMTLSNSVRKEIRSLFKNYSRILEDNYVRNLEITDEVYDNFFEDLFKILRISADRVIRQSYEKLQRVRAKQEESDLDLIIKNYVYSHTAVNVVRINLTTRLAIQRAIAVGIEEGLALSAIGKKLQKLPILAPYRATLIARTETHSAMNHGHQKTAELLGLTKPLKKWVSALDDRTRSWHRFVNQGQPIGINENFIIMTPTSKGNPPVPKELQYAGDMNGGASNTINCRCFVLYFDSSDIIEK